MNELKEKSSAGLTTAFLTFFVLFFNFESRGQMPQLFTEEVLSLTLSGDLKTVFKDRGDDSQYHPAELSYFSDQKKVSIPLKIKTRGNFRKSVHFRDRKTELTPSSEFVRLRYLDYSRIS